MQLAALILNTKSCVKEKTGRPVARSDEATLQRRGMLFESMRSQIDGRMLLKIGGHP